MILDRGMHVDKGPRFNFPTHVRAFISSGDVFSFEIENLSKFKLTNLSGLISWSPA
jgi:hypothetical protein